MGPESATLRCHQLVVLVFLPTESLEEVTLARVRVRVTLLSTGIGVTLFDAWEPVSSLIQTRIAREVTPLKLQR